MLKIVVYTDSNLLIPKKFGAFTRAFFIFIRTKYKDDTALLEHELVHVRQFWRTFGLSLLLYSLSKKYRLTAEVEAYQIQLQVHERVDTLPNEEMDAVRLLYADFISTKYGLDISTVDAYRLLQPVQ